MMGNKFILGTANLGTKYGLNNQGDFSAENSFNVITHALSRGIQIFDTAAQYGIAEELLGKATLSRSGVKLITKIPAREEYTFEYVLSCLEKSLFLLKKNNIYGLMFHDPEVHMKNEIKDISKKLIDMGRIEHIGFSGYTLEAVLIAKEKHPDWTIFQLPENILDRRFKDSQEISELAILGCIFHIRSVFLQGLLLMKIENIPIKFLKYKKIFEQLHFLAEELGVTVLDLCLSYVSRISWSSGSIVAAASTAQLDEILNYTDVELNFDLLEKLPIQVLDPRRWDELA